MHVRPQRSKLCFSAKNSKIPENVSLVYMFSWNNKHLQLLKGHKRQMFIIYNESIMSTTPHDLINNILIPVSLTKLAGPFHHRLFDLPINKIFISITTGRQCSSSSHYYQCQNKYFVLIKLKEQLLLRPGSIHYSPMCVEGCPA